MTTQQRVAAGVIGAVIGLGATEKISTHDAFTHFANWIAGHPDYITLHYDALAWMLGGAIVGIAATFLRR